MCALSLCRCSISMLPSRVLGLIGYTLIKHMLINPLLEKKRMLTYKYLAMSFFVLFVSLGYLHRIVMSTKLKR